MISNIHALV